MIRETTFLMFVFVFFGLVTQVPILKGQDIDRPGIVHAIKNYERKNNKNIYRLLKEKKVKELKESLKVRKLQGGNILVTMIIEEEFGNKIIQTYITHPTKNKIHIQEWGEIKSVVDSFSLDKKYTLIIWRGETAGKLYLSIVDPRGKRISTEKMSDIRRVHNVMVMKKKAQIIYSPRTKKNPDCLLLRVFHINEPEKGKWTFNKSYIQKILTNNFIQSNITYPSIKYINEHIVGVWLEYILKDDGKINWRKCRAVIRIFKLNLNNNNKLNFLGEKKLRKYRFGHHGAPRLKFDINVSSDESGNTSIQLFGKIWERYGTGETGDIIEKRTDKLYEGTIDKLIDMLKKENELKTCEKPLKSKGDKEEKKEQSEIDREDKALKEFKEQKKRTIERVKELRQGDKEDEDK